MARLGPPPHYHNWTPEKLKEEIEKLQEKGKELMRTYSDAHRRLRDNQKTIRSMQYYLVCNSGLRDTLRGWDGGNI